MTAWCDANIKAFLSKAEVHHMPTTDALMNNLSTLVEALEPAAVAKGGDSSALVDITLSMYPWHAKVTKVKSASGEGHIAVVRGTKRFIFDYSASMNWSVVIDEAAPGGAALEGLDPAALGAAGAKQKATYKGTLVYEELSSARPSDFDWAASPTTTYTTAVPHHHKPVVTEILRRLKLDIGDRIAQFTEAYKQRS